MYSLYREGDNAGDCGPLMQIGKPGGFLEVSDRPKVGYCVRVGSINGRTYASQDFWTTTPVIEILEETSHSMKFKTRSGSIYVWTKQ